MLIVCHMCFESQSPCPQFQEWGKSLWISIRYVHAKSFEYSCTLKIAIRPEKCRHGHTFDILSLLSRASILTLCNQSINQSIMFCCMLTSNGSTTALKIIRNVVKYRDAAKLEINVLDKVNRIECNGEK